MFSTRGELKIKLNEALSKNLLAIKACRGLRNNTELAHFLGIHKGTLDFWLYDLSVPKLTILMEVAERLGITVSHLTGEVELTPAMLEEICKDKA